MTNIIKHQSMRIAGKKVDAEKNINVHYPYTNEIIGTVPAGSAEHAKQALEIANAVRGAEEGREGGVVGRKTTVEEDEGRYDSKFEELPRTPEPPPLTK